MLKVYNSFTNQLETFKPINKRSVKMYVCGPTVYNYIHIGNARSVVAFDTIRRYLEYLGYYVTYVSNFTDIDDKIINEANKEGISYDVLTNRYIDAFMEDTAALNVKPATNNPRATEHIDDIIKFIEELIDDGMAYVSNGSVYFRAKKFKNYGKLSNKNIDELENGASQHITEAEANEKEDPIDFVLWKKVKLNEVYWDAPFGKGRPGWHIECSVMSNKYLGNNFDIHGGGIDLEFPHHENEIAQSESKNKEKFANYWLHNGFVTVGDQNEKMSKSLGNFITVHDLIKEVNPEVVRFLMSTTQYRRPIAYNQEKVTEAENNLKKIKNAYNNLEHRMSSADEGNDPKIDQEVRQIQANFQDAMDDDFNAQNGIAEVYELAKLGNIYSERDFVFDKTISLILNRLNELSSIFGIDLATEDLADDEVKSLIEQRNNARKNKDFALSDKIRDELKEKGIILEDTNAGTRFRREN
ncbi:cysteine--tRNA ligase [Lactobacillus sp. S2-2]|uniref:cysteine--tRNA ligase n=1 Tax=Lactobacillus sp. S2-2 TaxID=2692917 RepID=UPI001F019167|nr:cysteine--tRNA ligase [Lactobacillus sp. S2-2]MCF6515640.1 cysteine--tRNA ligase [Lactobacillus sp. S2-2]